MIKIHLKQKINSYLTKNELQAKRILINLKLVLNTQMIWMIFVRTLKNIEKYNPNKQRKTLSVFDDMIDDMLSNKKLYQIVT